MCASSSSGSSRPDDDGLGLAQGTLKLVDHDPRWAMAFAAEARHLSTLLPPGAEIHHIGSTAVPGLLAKPILDLGLALPATLHEDAVRAMVADDYIDRGERSGRLLIRLRDGKVRTHNLHLYPTRDVRLTEQIAFRDRLRADPALRAAYAADKRRIVESGTARRDYADAKTAFIRAALA
ncbi:MAG: GrpB family protein [Pseudomonadota bacterium]